MAKALSLDELKHLKLNVSGLILEKKEEIDIEERLQLICNAIYNKKEIYTAKYFDNNKFGLRVYKIKRKSAWGDFDNILHHYVFIYQPEDYVDYIFIGFSEQQKMNKIIKAINNNVVDELQKLSKLDFKILKSAFLSKKIYTMWMNNQVRRTIYKPDNKVLMGNIENTLNPVMDSSFSFSSARGKLEDKKIVVRPTSSKFFLKQSRSLEDLEKLFDEVLEYIEINKSNSFKLDFLLEHIEYKNFIDDFGCCEDFILKSPDWLESLGLFEESTDLRKDEYELVYDNLSFDAVDVQDSPKDSDTKYFASIEVIYFNSRFIVNFYQLPYITKYKSRIDDYEELRKLNQDERILIDKIFNATEFMKFYFNCGHIIDSNEVYKNTYNNINYNDEKIIGQSFQENSKKYDIKLEKPVNSDNSFDKSQIGKSNSLFCWTVNNWNHNILEDKKEIVKEYLVCDDGSNEIADFIHLVKLKNDKYIINFLHIKASKSEQGKQRTSVGAFDIVLTQAIKNARYTDLTQLKDQMKSNSKSINELWINNKKSNKLKKDDFIKIINNIVENNYFYEANIIVIQPHLIKEEYKISKDSNNKKLLNTLFHAANSAISGFSSSLYVVCTDKKINKKSNS